MLLPRRGATANMYLLGRMKMIQGNINSQARTEQNCFDTSGCGDDTQPDLFPKGDVFLNKINNMDNYIDQEHGDQ